MALAPGDFSFHPPLCALCAPPVMPIHPSVSKKKKKLSWYPTQANHTNAPAQPVRPAHPNSRHPLNLAHPPLVPSHATPSPGPAILPTYAQSRPLSHAVRPRNGADGKTTMATRSAAGVSGQHVVVTRILVFTYVLEIHTSAQFVMCIQVCTCG